MWGSGSEGWEEDNAFLIGSSLRGALGERGGKGDVVRLKSVAHGSGKDGRELGECICGMQSKPIPGLKIATWCKCDTTR